MNLPVIRGIIGRRILVNYRVDPDALRRILPPPFQPQLVNGMGIAGICLIRLKAIRPAWLSPPPGLVLGKRRPSHRRDVGESRRTYHGVYIPRRDSNSRPERVMHFSMSRDGHFDGLELRCRNWTVHPLDVTKVHSSFFDDPSVFPPGSCHFDCALLMRGVEHEWHDRGQLCATPAEAACV